MDQDHSEDITNQSEAVLEQLSNPKREDRALSLLDLIDKKGLDLDLAAWLVAQVSSGASFITGAGPGGVGKTTTMRALLAFAPGGALFSEALPEKIEALAGEQQRCVISHELSDHTPPNYLWDDDLRAFFALGEAGHMLVGNMHANELEEVHAQIVGANGVGEAVFRAIKLFVFVGIDGEDLNAGRINNPTARRYMRKIYYTDGTQPHRLVLEAPGALAADAPRDIEREAQCRAFLEEALAAEERDIVALRRRFLARAI